MSTLPEEVRRRLTTPRLACWLSAALFDWIVIVVALAAFACMPNPLTLVVAILLVGNRQHALAILAHDGAHGTVCRHRGLNRFLANGLAFWPLGQTFLGYKRSHDRHHQRVGHDDDPELAHRRTRPRQWRLPATRRRVLCYLLFDLSGMSAGDALQLMKMFKPARPVDLLPVLLLHASVAALLSGLGLLPCLGVWYFCLFTSFWACFRWRIWLEHVGARRKTHRVTLPWHLRFLVAPHNTGMHWEHHLCPRIPFHRLPECRKAIGARGGPIDTLESLFMTLSKAQEWG